MVLKNLATKKSASEEEMLQILFIGDTNRVVCQTPLNDKSTRSHCIFTIYLESQKIKYYEFMTRYYIHEKMIMDIAKSQQIIYDTLHEADAALGQDPTGQKKQISFQNFSFYLMVSPYSNEKIDFLNIVNTKYSRELDTNELIARYLKKFLTYELMPMKEDEVEQ